MPGVASFLPLAFGLSLSYPDNVTRRTIISYLLALMLALTSQSMAVARGSAAAADQVVLCTGNGPVAIYIDAEGNPTTAPHICPDSALNVLVEPSIKDLDWSVVTADSEVAKMPAPIQFSQHRVGIPQSRAPPV